MCTSKHNCVFGCFFAAHSSNSLGDDVETKYFRRIRARGRMVVARMISSDVSLVMAGVREDGNGS